MGFLSTVKTSLKTFASYGKKNWKKEFVWALGIGFTAIAQGCIGRTFGKLFNKKNKRNATKQVKTLFKTGASLEKEASKATKEYEKAVKKIF